MNDSRLKIYLNDHLALMVGEIELARRCESSNRETSLGEFLQRLAADIEAQRQVVSDLIRRIGGSESMLKKRAAWFAEKLGRFKLNGSLLTYSELSRVIELEALTAAAQERVALWDTLEAIIAGDSRLAGVDVGRLRDQSQEQLAELSTQRRDAAMWAFA